LFIVAGCLEVVTILVDRDCGPEKIDIDGLIDLEVNGLVKIGTNLIV
jgi:hypothetical protein